MGFILRLVRCCLPTQADKKLTTKLLKLHRHRATSLTNLKPQISIMKQC